MKLHAHPILFALLLVPLASHAQTPAPSVPVITAATDLSQYPTADSLWLHIQDLKKLPKTRPANAQQFQASITNLLAGLASAAVEFQKRYPNDTRHWDARLLEVDTRITLHRIDNFNDDGRAEKQLSELAFQKDAPSNIRAQARYELFSITMQNYMKGNVAISSQDVISQLNQFIADFPTFPSVDSLKYNVAESIGSKDSAMCELLLKQIADSGQGALPDQARAELALRARLKAPINLNFTAVDGSQVDMSKLRGKVVLLDFWASWPAQCRAQFPRILAAYQKFHPKGFEIVGISLDRDKNDLLKCMTANGMTWPQYFDGKGLQNIISSSFGIRSLPAMWLIDKSGFVASTTGGADLEEQIQMLLAENSR